MSYESNVPTKVKCFYCQKSISRETYGGDETGVWHKTCRASYKRRMRKLSNLQKPEEGLKDE